MKNYPRLQKVQERGIPWVLASTRASPQEASPRPPGAGQAAGLGSVAPLGLSWPRAGTAQPTWTQPGGQARGAPEGSSQSQEQPGPQPERDAQDRVRARCHSKPHLSPKDQKVTVREVVKIQDMKTLENKHTHKNNEKRVYLR